MPKADLKTRFLACIPAPLDFVVPTRFPRKFAMVGSWLSVCAVALLIVALCSAHWLLQSTVISVSLGNSGNATVTTTGSYGLRTYSLTVTTQTDTQTVSYESGTVASLLGLGALASTSSAVLVVLIISLVVEIVATFACFWHGWARWIAKITFFSAAFSTLLGLLCSLVCFLMYVASVPKTPHGFSLGWGCWVCLASALLELVILVLVLIDKPTGLIRYQKGDGIVPDSAETGTPSTAMSSTTSKKPSAAIAPTSHPPPPPVSRQQPPPHPHPQPQPPPRREAVVQLKALFDCTAEAEGDLSFRAGEILVLVSDAPGDGWLTGRKSDGKTGILPSNYVTRM